MSRDSALAAWFADAVVEGDRPAIAMQKAAFKAALFCFEQQQRGSDLRGALRELRIPNPDQVAEAAEGQTKKTRGRPSTPDVKSFGIYTILPLPGGPANAPDPACIDARLPAGRKPTVEEILEAWEACSK